MEPVYEQIHNNLGLPITVYHINSWELPTLIYCNWHKELEFIYVKSTTEKRLLHSTVRSLCFLFL